MKIISGLLLTALVASAGYYLSDLIGVTLMGMSKSPISPIMMAIIIGLLLRNTFGLSEKYYPGIQFGLKRVLRAGIVLLGIRLSMEQIGDIGLQSLPVIIACVVSALFFVTYVGKKLGLNGRLSTLIALGTSICGATAIMAIAPAINARDNEVSYAVACITLFGLVAMLVYPFAGHWIFEGDALNIGMFLGTAIHDTSQVAGAGLVYQQYYGDPYVLDVATVTKLLRNLGLLIVIPLMSIAYRRKESKLAHQRWWKMIPLFVIGFAFMSLLRTLGDIFEPSWTFAQVNQWHSFVSFTKSTAGIFLTIAMASVGLSTNLVELKSIGIKPMVVGLSAALSVGVVSISLISLL